MKRILPLPQELISQIAAGEVIERPASVVKELVENSLDAGASQITIEIEEGGLKKIRVVDNGEGMEADDARLAFLRHATSKIATQEDLFQIRTLGFRGEALASIASVSRVSLKTRPPEERIGTLVRIDGAQQAAQQGTDAKELESEECACDSGTEVTVLDLFSMMPARKKYMKSERIEYGHIFDLLVGIVLAHPAQGFRLFRNGNLVFDLSPQQNLKERIRVLFGPSVAGALVPATYLQSNLNIQGFIGKPELARSAKKYQFLFMNGRAISDRSLSHAVKEAFHSLLMHEKYPWFLLDMSIDPTQVDVNTHPRKLEVKFVNAQEIYRAVFGAVQAALEQYGLQDKFSQDVSSQDESSQHGLLHESSVQREFSGEPALRRNFAASQLFDVKGLRFRPLAQIAHAYIVAEGEEGLVLIDQHAAHERVRYERFMKELAEKSVSKQALVVPAELDFGVDGARLIQDYLEDFIALGYELEHFGGSTFLLRTVPTGLEEKEPERVVLEIVSSLTEEWKLSPVKNLRESLLTLTACRGAIKFGDPLTLPQMESLIREMERTANAHHCPHGRPSIISFSFEDLEARFKRRNV